MIGKSDVLSAIACWPARYTTATGRVVVGEAVSAVTTALRGEGWKGVPRLDAYDLKKMGLEIVEAYYSAGGRKGGRMISVVVLREGV